MSKRDKRREQVRMKSRVRIRKLDKERSRNNEDEGNRNIWENKEARKESRGDIE